MIRTVFRRLREAGVLGINSRNADYIMRWNPRSSYPIVDNKIRTKALADKHQIPTPPRYYLVENHGSIAGLEKALGGRREFVVKPARGSGGSGIILVKDCTAEGWVTQSGAVISRGDFAYYISEILSGVYSLEGLEDRAIIEALIHPDPVFSAVTYQGVPDVRIVVYRGVPIMAMVRLPTRASDGKANLHRGAIGAGIEISSGTTLTAVHRSQVVTHHPDTGNRVAGIQVPFWDRLLLMAARSLDMTGLGYVGVDLVLDREDGPLLLEMNARPGLAIQVANRQGLRGRLERTDRAAPEIFSTPESRVAWAKENL